jgi:SAM-dependent methyltransferase
MAKQKLTQERLFLSGEGDAYFKRNLQAIHMPKPWTTDPGLRMLREQRLRPRRMLDLGCSNGWRCAAIRQRYGCQCLGVDPSRKAISAGRKQFPDVRFRRGVLDNLPLRPGETYDLVIVNYVLHWVSRQTLLKALAEIDRSVADGGYLILGDFLPDQPTRVVYHHLPKGLVYTYKLDYAQIFLDTGLYRTIRRRVFDHHTHRPGKSIPPHRRAVCTLLKKSTQSYYENGSWSRRDAKATDRENV